MEFIYAIVLLVVGITLSNFLNLALKRRAISTNLPPSPPSLPLLGHLHLLKEPYHRSLTTLSDRYGPVLHLRLGRLPVLVISSPSGAEQCFSHYDVAFANRPKFMAGQHIGYNFSTVIWASYGHHWTILRRAVALGALSSNRLQQLSYIREEEVLLMVRRLAESCVTKVNLATVFLQLTHNVVMRMVCGKRWTSSRWISPTGNFASVCDFLPVLRWIGYGGEERKMKERQKWRDGFVQGLIDEGRAMEAAGLGAESAKTLVQEVLALQEGDPVYYTDEILRGIIAIVLTAGTDTTARTIEWAMSLLLNHPDVLVKARHEIKAELDHNGLVKDCELHKLTYLRCIINETLRLYPPGPLLLPHFSTEDCTIEGYHVPENTVLLVNAMAIHRDPKVWEEPTKFKPERWLVEPKAAGEGAVGVNSFKFLPFSAGRRACPGANLATRVVTLALATLIQCFDWERVGPELVDMEESGGITMPKLRPLEAICTPTSSLRTFFTTLEESH